MLPVRHVSLEIGSLLGGLEYEMNMIGHEAVRMNCKPESACALPNRRQYSPDQRRVYESRLSKTRADGDGISMQPNIREAPNAARPARKHATRSASTVPQRRTALKGCATDDEERAVPPDGESISNRGGTGLQPCCENLHSSLYAQP